MAALLSLIIRHYICNRVVGTGMSVSSVAYSLDAFANDIQGAPMKNNPPDKLLYFSNGSTDLSQTFTLYI